jgi:hypothetical protein
MTHDTDTNDFDGEAKRLIGQLFDNGAVIRSLTTCGFENVHVDVGQCDRPLTLSMMAPATEPPPCRLEVVLAIRIALLERGYRLRDDTLTINIEAISA